jgi:hypothetical protein
VVPVELHYLMSCYGDDRTLEPQRILGSAFAFLHAEPQLTRTQIRTAIADPSRPFLAASDLAEQIDLIRFAPINLTLDELSRLWSVFLQTHYVLSATFKASTVLLERAIAPRPPLPVRAVQLVAMPLRSPRIASIVSAVGDTTPITTGTSIMVGGSDLLGDSTIVEIDGVAVPVTTAANDRIVLPLPAGIMAGPHALQVRQGIVIAGVGPPHSAFASDLATFIVQPVITKTAGVPDVTIADIQGAGTEARAATVTIHATPDIGVQQTATLEMSRAQQVVSRFLAQPLAAPGGQLTFKVSGLAAGDYFIQLRIDGAVSPLDLDPNGTPLGPKGTIP